MSTISSDSDMGMSDEHSDNDAVTTDSRNTIKKNVPKGNNAPKKNNSSKAAKPDKSAIKKDIRKRSTPRINNGRSMSKLPMDKLKLNLVNVDMTLRVNQPAGVTNERKKTCTQQ